MQITITKLSNLNYQFEATGTNYSVKQTYSNLPKFTAKKIFLKLIKLQK